MKKKTLTSIERYLTDGSPDREHRLMIGLVIELILFTNTINIERINCCDAQRHDKQFGRLFD